MTKLVPIHVALTAALLGCVNAPAQNASAAGWRLEPAQSSVHFVTTKAGQPGVAAIAEVQSFRRFNGELNSQGQVQFSIDLASVDTGVEIRDERLRTMLFNVGATPQATFSAKLDPALLRELPTAGVRDIDLDGQLTLAGQSKPVVAKVRVAALGPNLIGVSTRAPIVVNATDFGLRAGVEALREVMGLSMISAAAPVSFALVMRQQN
jgi:polyisoprenoid-binding protein YceI